MFLFVIAVPGQELNNWTRYTSDAGAYSVLLPTQPKLEEQEVSSPAGTKFTQYMAKALLSDQLLMIAYFDISPGSTYSLDKGRDGAVKAIDGTLVSEELISLGGKPGLKLRIRANRNNRDMIDLVRIYNINGRVYVLQSIFFQTTEEAPYLARANKFFDSFAVKER
jgi:hypothetical protein